MINSDLRNILPQVRGSYRFNTLIKNWFDVKTYAEIIFKPKDQEDLVYFLKNFSQKDLIKIIGATSNIIFQNEVTEGLIIKLSSGFSYINICDNELSQDLLSKSPLSFVKKAAIDHSQISILDIGAATLCKNVANFTQSNSLSNLEFLTGIPGSIGGAIAMNAGCYGGEISNFLLLATAIDLNGVIHQFSNQDFGFYYRGSRLCKERSGELIFISARFACHKKDSELVAQTINQFNQAREESQPIRAKTGGSTFKNPVNSSKKAWQLIDQANCRGLKMNDAQISEKHCNFLVNQGHASGQDIVNLIEKVQQQVKNFTGEDLEMEIKIIK